jgi:ABC-type uncharacterized transport system fused permease/ATPase subunit
MKQSTRFLIGLLLGIVSYWYVRRGKKRTPPPKALGGSPDASKKYSKNLMYPEFRNDLMKLMKICYPEWNCLETKLSASFALVLIVRTLLSLAVAELDGRLVKSLIQLDVRNLAYSIIAWFMVGLPSSYVNALIKDLQTRLALAYRERLTTYARSLYFTNDAYYRIGNLDSRLQNVDHCLTEDINQWSERTADVMSAMGKPIVDLVIFSTALCQSLGFWNQFIASIVVYNSGEILRMVRPNFARMVTEKAAREGELRSAHARVINNAEEIAFFGGHLRESALLEGNFQNMVRFVKTSLRKQFHYRAMEDFVTKYLWSTVGLVQLAIPMYAEKDKRSLGANAQFMTTVKRMMLRNGDATERLVLGLKEVAEVCGYTKHVSDMFSALKDMHEGKYNMERMGTAKGVVMESVDNTIEVSNLPIVSPTGDVLVKEVTFTIYQKDRVLIHGPNGCGKSSLFRILCGLWPVLGGTVKKPMNRKDFLFLPQRPYLVKGTFRDQVIYPDTIKECLAKGIKDEDLAAILKQVDMEVPTSGWDAELEWKDTLSGGEKQRVGLARVLYHRPKYAILDECTSAITVDGEFNIFSRLTALPMGIITISHRQTLYAFHNKLLTFDGEGGYNFQAIRSEGIHALTELSDQKEKLVGKLKDICKQLGEDWPVFTSEK